MVVISFTQLVATAPSGAYIAATAVKLLASKAQAGQRPPDGSTSCRARCACAPKQQVRPRPGTAG